MILAGFNPDIWITTALNGLSGHSRGVDDAMRYLAVFGVLPLAVIAVFAALCPAKQPDRRGGLIALMGGGVAFVAARGLQELLIRPRPFTYHPVRLLVCYPNDASFPSIPMAAAAGLAFALGAYSRRFRPWVIGYLALGGLARVYVGIEYPLDVVGAWMVGSLAAFLMILLWDFRHLAGSKDSKLLVIATTGVLAAALVLAFRLPRVGIGVQQSSFAPKKPAMAPETTSLIKGFSPKIESRIAGELVKIPLPGAIEKVAVGGDDATQVASVRFSGGSARNRLPRAYLEIEAQSIVRGVFLVAPEIGEVDLSATVPHQEADGRRTREVVFTVAAQRKDAGFLLGPKSPEISSREALSRFGQVYYREEE